MIGQSARKLPSSQGVVRPLPLYRIETFEMGLLFDGDLGAALAGVRQVFDAAVDDRTNPL